MLIYQRVNGEIMFILFYNLFPLPRKPELVSECIRYIIYEADKGFKGDAFCTPIFSNNP
jgi:hypothetical protein